MAWIALGIAALAVGVPASALAQARPQTTVVGANGRVLTRENAWANRALVPPPVGKIIVRFGPCPRFPRFDACVQTWHKRTIYFRRAAPLADPRALFLHELGHVFDFTVMRAEDRLAFKRLFNRPERWWGGGAHPTGEWFADAYSLCARRRTLPARPAPTPYAYAPAPGTHAVACRLIARAARRLDGERKPAPTPEPVPPTIVEVPAEIPLPTPTPKPKPQPYRCFLIMTCYR